MCGPGDGGGASDGAGAGSSGSGRRPPPPPPLPPDDLDDDCKDKATDYEIEKACIDPHNTIKWKKQRYEICKCKSGRFVLKLKGCKGPIVEHIW